MAKCSNCGVELRVINISGRVEVKPPDNGVRMAHPTHAFKVACDRVAELRRKHTVQVAGQMFYDPVAQEYLWRAVNVAR